MSEHLPIVFIHTGNHDYLPLSIYQAKKSNPGSEVWLLGDTHNRHFGLWVKHDYLKKYFREAEKLSRVFINYSSNPHDFELICLQRWLALHEFMNHKNMERCLYIDSDVLLYDEVNTYAAKVARYGMTVAGISGHTNFIMKREVLGAFAQLILDTYSRDDAEKWLMDTYAEFRKYNELGGISDMTFFTEFRRLYPQYVYDAWHPIDGVACDITIDYHLGYEHAENGNKLIFWQNDKPYCKTLSGELIQFISLHFQGKSKLYMEAMLSRFPTSIKLLHNTNKVLVFISRAIKKLTRKVG